MSKKPRILIYSHDTFGLGHLRRCRTIAHAMVEQDPDMSVLILSGSPIIGSFEFRSRVDFVRIPGVIKLRNGDYTSLNLSIDIEHTLAIRSSIIEHTAKIFKPDIFLVDKEPTGLRGEIIPTLEHLKTTNTRLVLGLRDVLDDAEQLQEEWTRKGAFEALDFYDDIWVYGLSSIHNPLEGIDVTEENYRKVLYTGYLKRGLIRSTVPDEPEPFGADPFILVTPGGGGDGVELCDWVMRAYEAREAPLFPALLVLGPFMDTDHQSQFERRAKELRNIKVLRFTPNIEVLMQKAMAIVGMGGYNTFCEILSFNKPTVLVPRVVPRREQSIRAARAKAAGLVNVLPIDEYPDVEPMIDALVNLPQQAPPQASGLNGLLNGLDVINQQTRCILHTPEQFAAQ